MFLSHRPEKAEFYAENGFDLVLCGHAHGGQIRVPGIFNGIYAPHQGLFPKYAGGRYDFDKTTVIVSRGLKKNWLPRTFNQTGIPTRRLLQPLRKEVRDG